MSFFEPSQNPQILFIFQFVQLFSSQYTCSRPISDLSYRSLFSKPYFSIFRGVLQILLQLNLASKFLLLYFFSFKSCSYLSLFKRYYSYLVLRVQNLAYLVLRILRYRKLLSHTYLYIFKLSYYSLLLVIVYYRSLSCPYLVLRVLDFSYLVLRILSLWPFAFIKW